MAIPKPTMNLRWREANDDELYHGKQKFPFAIIKKEEQTVKFERYYILEQQFRIETIEGVEFVWVSVPIADENINLDK